MITPAIPSERQGERVTDQPDAEKQRAIADSHRAIKLNPRFASAYSNRGFALSVSSPRGCCLALQIVPRAPAITPSSDTRFILGCGGERR